MVFGIALQLCHTNKKAEKVLVLTFEKAYHHNMDRLKGKGACIDLIKLTIKTAQQELYPREKKCNFRIKQFETIPVIHKLLVDQLSLEDYCEEDGIPRHMAMLNIRNEFKMYAMNETE